jgi:HK97 family phage prohead protease
LRPHLGHLTDKALARTTAGTLELSSNAHGLRFFASCSRTSYADDLRVLMNDGVVTQSSFAFNVAPGCEDWTDDAGPITRTVTKVGELYDICVTAAGASPATDSAVARTLALSYALEHGLIGTDSAAALRIARIRTDIYLRKNRIRLRT